MILHTDFHDYYDHAIGFGVDEKVHYNRYRKPASIDLKSYLERPFHRNSGLIGFCGNTFPFVELHKYDRNFDDECEWGEYRVVETRFAFNFDEYRAVQREWGTFNDFYMYMSSTDLKIKQFFFDWKVNSDAIFLEHKVPIWAAKFYTEEPNGILSPCLRDYGFEKVKHSFTAFQEISMYLANILVERKEVALIEDRYRIQQHGFDLKESFRSGKKGKTGRTNR